MNQIIAREKQRKANYEIKLLNQIVKLVPRLVKKAERKSRRGKVATAELSIRPYYATISHHPKKNNFFDNGANEAKVEIELWMVNEADKLLTELGSPLHAYFRETFAAMGFQSTNKLGVKLKSP
ncbi:hypothetical protein H7100_00840 [Candidatus Saccharibacteria bacterium]|nr:hypothetical protein [Candidatus Saccharibacteria bacterium]